MEIPNEINVAVILSDEEACKWLDSFLSREYPHFRPQYYSGWEQFIGGQEGNEKWGGLIVETTFLGMVHDANAVGDIDPSIPLMLIHCPSTHKNGRIGCPNVLGIFALTESDIREMCRVIEGKSVLPQPAAVLKRDTITLRAMAEHSAECIVLTDHEGELRYANRSARRNRNTVRSVLARYKIAELEEGTDIVPIGDASGAEVKCEVEHRKVHLGEETFHIFYLRKVTQHTTQQLGSSFEKLITAITALVPQITSGKHLSHSSLIEQMLRLCAQLCEASVAFYMEIDEEQGGLFCTILNMKEGGVCTNDSHIDEGILLQRYLDAELRFSLEQELYELADMTKYGRTVKSKALEKLSRKLNWSIFDTPNVAVVPISSEGSPKGWLFIGGVTQRYKEGGYQLFCGLGLLMELAMQALESIQHFRVQRKLNKTLLDNSNEIVLIIDDKGRIQSANKIAQYALTAFPDTLVGRSLRELIPQAHNTELIEIIREKCAASHENYEENADFWNVLPKVIHKNELSDVKLIMESTHGEKIPVRAGFYSLSQPYSPKHCVLFIATDNREEIHSIQDIAQYKEASHQRRRWEALGLFSRRLCHDFSNRLQVIIGNVETIEQNLTEIDPLYPKVANVIQAVRAAEKMIKNVSGFYGGTPAPAEVIKVNETITSIMGIMRDCIGEDIELTIRQSEDDPKIKVNRSDFEDAIFNLVKNAKEAMPNGGQLIVTVQSRYHDQKFGATRYGLQRGSYTIITISDTGCGIERKYLDKIFDPLFSTKQGAEGKMSGLGLAGVYRFIEDCQGQILVQSQVNEGTTFQLFLPETKEPVSAPPLRVQDIYGKGESIMLVEDDPRELNIIVETLEYLKYKVTIAENAGDALRFIDQRGYSPDLLLTEVKLPKMNGIELARHLKGRFPELKVVFIDGSFDNLASLQDESEDYSVIQKPIDFKTLGVVIRGALS